MKDLNTYSNASLRYHFHPEKGWLNDPNGLSFFKGHYHIFYQHNPNTEYAAPPMHWGHATTDDFRTFTELKPAIYPDMPYDINGVWSGTAIEHNGKLFCYYASLDANNRQTVSLATSDDGVNFEKYPGNPIISDYPINCAPDFRDPAILCVGDKYYLAIASADKDRKTGCILLYRSDDMYSWTYSGILREYEDCIYTECPSFVKCGEKYILAVSVCHSTQSHFFEVMYGDFDGEKFTPEIVSHFQKGPDEYAGQIFNAPDGRPILISWLPGWDYIPRNKCIGCLSLPLELSVKDGKILAYPIDSVRDLLDENDVLTDSYITEKFVNKGEEVYIYLDK